MGHSPCNSTIRWIPHQLSTPNGQLIKPSPFELESYLFLIKLFSSANDIFPPKATKIFSQIKTKRKWVVVQDVQQSSIP